MVDHVFKMFFLLRPNMTSGVLKAKNDASFASKSIAIEFGSFIIHETQISHDVTAMNDSSNSPPRGLLTIRG